MKKFFTLCLAFMLASLLNVNAADTYTLVGANVNGKSWDQTATQNDFTYDEATDSYVITGVTMSGEFKVAKDHAWTTSWGSNGKPIPTGAAYLAWKNGGNIAMSDNQTYTNCTVRFKLLDSEAASILITSDTAMSGAIDTQVSEWCIAGVFADGEHWDDTNVMTDLGGGVYEWWCETLPSEFKFKGKGSWDFNFGIPANNGKDRYTAILGYENAVDNGGNNIKMTGNAAYNKYRIRLTVRGYVASFRVDGYKQATQPVTVFYESFDGCAGSGANDGKGFGDLDNGVSTGTFKADYTGWVVNKANAAYKAAKFGNSKTAGSGVVTTPALNLTGDGVITFKAAPWGTDGTTLNLSISSGTLSTESVTMTKGQWTEYTVKITGATPDATLTFTPAKRFFLDEVKVVQGDASADMKAAEITLNGVMKDAETAYYHGSLTNPTVTVTLPAGATYMDVEVDNSGYITESRKNQTSDCTIPFYNAGNYTVRVTAYGEGVYSVASKDIAIETVSNVNTFDELINKGEGAIGALGFSPTVVAHVGKYLYLEGYDMWDGIRSSALVYASLDKTYKKGDVLQGFIATVAYYNGNPQLIPLTTSLGDPFGMSEPYVYEVEAGDAWKAFAVEANVNKYVRVKNAPVTADAVDGVAVYTKNLGVNMPEDLTKKYDVEGFINNFKGTIQIQPISFTAEEIKPFTYTEIVPANNAEVTSLSEIKITFPYDVTYDATVNMGVLVMDGNNMITPTVAVEGAVATLTFDAITAYGSKPSLSVMAGAFKEATSGVGCQQIIAAWSIPTPPIVPGLTLAKATPANGSTVEKLERITLQISGDVYDCRYASQSYGNEFITVTDDKGNSYNGKIGYTNYTDKYYLYVENATAPGTYTITIKEGVFGDEEYLKKYAKGLTNPEIVLTYTIKSASLAAPTVDPANGAEVENLNTITLTFAEAVTANAEAGAITLVNNSNQNLDYAKNIAVAISEDGLTATITSEPSLGAWTAETYTMSIPAGYFVATSGAANEALSYNWKVVAPKFTYVAVDPAQGEVESLETIFIDFGGFRPRLIDGFMYPTYNLVNANGETVTTAATNYSYEQINGSYYYKLKVTLGAKVTTPGDYFLTIPAGVFKDKDVYSGYNENAEMTFKWTVAVPGPKDGFTYETITPDPSQEVSSIESVVVTFPADVTYDNSLVMLGVNAMTLMNTLTVTVEGNTVTFTPAAPITAEGSHQLTWNEGAFTAANGAKCAKATINYTVAKADPNTYNYELAADPANGSTLPALTTINFNDPSFATVAFLTDEAKNTSNWVVVEDAEGNMYNTTLDNTTGVTISVEGATAPGTYSVYVPAKTFYDMMAFSKDGKYNYNPEMRLTYTVEGETVEDFTPAVVPAAGDITVDQMDVTVITFESPIASFDPGYVKYIKSIGSVWFDGVGEYTISEDKLTLTLNWNLVKGNYPVGSNYTLELPAGCIVLENGAKNLETHINYTIVAPIPEDFTPVINPTAGNITVDQMNVTVISVDSPIASFDPANVKYIKSIGNVWFETMGEYTISEDKLTLTLNWNLVKGNYPPGTSYTLELPAGCIVLENGAKNLFTQVAYTVVAGPKDLAEFVVPAGMNGYVNYDETDVNAWAPEFPFTVSTTAYNTVAFAAELPSLPAGVTAMEVIDENGEVIATLNQDGVAPLADGEIYYVKGETTKEYADGAELKFRFRFTHLGVSETIQFSYIVAGGNITSIADVELDGNVIVRGNDIIAPEGAAIFTVSGIRVPAEGLAPGVYVVVLGNQAVKVMVK